MKLLRAFLIRDFYTETSYRVSFLVGIMSTLFRVFIFYFLSRLIGESVAGALREYDGDYFSFVIIGIAFSGYFGTGLTGFARALRQAQTTGTLEAMLVTPTPASWIILGSATWSYTFTTFRVLVYLLTGTLIFGLNLGSANYAAAAAILVLSIISFASIGIVVASLIMIIKRGDPLTTLISNLATLIGGVFYPVEVMPDWLQIIAGLLPITYGFLVRIGRGLAGAVSLLPDPLPLFSVSVSLGCGSRPHRWQPGSLLSRKRNAIR
jgi:ABC-2 type transport system permease protein